MESEDGRPRDIIEVKSWGEATKAGDANERIFLGDVLHDEDDAVGDSSDDDDGGGCGDEQEGTVSDESKDTGSVAKPKPRILPKTPKTFII